MTENALTVRTSGDMLTDADAFDQGYRAAKLFASSSLVPAHLKGKPEDCFIALHMAKKMNEDPLMVMQNIYIVSGKAGWSAQFMIGRANRSGLFKDQITWETTGDGAALSVTAKATLQNGAEIHATASMAMANAEGWTKNAKYKSMPEHMLRYRSATFLIRLYAPEVMLGLPTADENEDVAASKAKDVTPPRPRREDFVVETEAPENAHEVRDVAPTRGNPSAVLAAPQAEAKAEDSPATYADMAKFAIIDSDGEIKEFDDATEAAKGLCGLLQSAYRARNDAALEGIWESNGLFLEQCDEAVKARLKAYYERLSPLFNPQHDALPDMGE